MQTTRVPTAAYLSRPPRIRRTTRLLLRLSMALGLLVCAAQAQAAFGTCSTPQYLQRFDERLSRYDCVVSHEADDQAENDAKGKRGRAHAGRQGLT